MNKISIQIGDENESDPVTIIENFLLDEKGIKEEFQYANQSICIQGGIMNGQLTLMLLVDEIERFMVLGNFSPIGPSTFTQRITDSIYCHIYLEKIT